MMNFNHLYYFYVIVTEGGLQRASRKLNVTQPALSIQLKALENNLGKLLFIREHRRLTLTSDGVYLFNHARTMFETASQAIKAVKTKELSSSETVRIGVVPSLFKSMIHDILRPLWKSGYYVTVRQDSLSELLGGTETRRPQVILTDVVPRGLSTEYETHRMKSRKLLVVGAEKFRRLSRGFPASLGGAPFITFTNFNPVRLEVEEYFQARGIEPDYRGEIDDFSMMQIVLEDGFAVGILSEVAAASSLKSRRLFKLGELPRIGTEVLVLVQRGSNSVARALGLE